MERQAVLQHLAYIFSYPQSEYKDRVEAVYQWFRRKPRLNQHIRPFAEFIRNQTMEAIEEQFTRTFDMRPSTCLEIGWHLYGEDYKRGQFLVKMRQALAEHGVAETIELPDHLSHCLMLLAALPEDEAKIFFRDYLKPAMQRILQGFEEENPFRSAIEFLHELLYELFGRRNGAAG